MKVTLARNAGFCFGVKRAINLALETSEKYPEVVTIGPIIHNPQLVNSLRGKGIIPINNPEEVEGRPVIVRSHGITKELLENLQKLGIPVINATCPFVANGQQWATKLSEENYPIMIVGDEYHPEIIALKSYVQSSEVYVVNSVEQIEEKIYSKLALICQTTQSIELLQAIVDKLLPLSKELRIINSICSATRIRQESTSKLAHKTDLMIVVGGKISANTGMMYEICKKNVETHLIETAKEFDCNWLTGKKNIGLTAGASTPDWIIVEVYNIIMQCLGDTGGSVTNIQDIPGYKEEKRCI